MSGPVHGCTVDGGLGVIPDWATDDVQDGGIGMQLRASLTLCFVILMTLYFPFGAYYLFVFIQTMADNVNPELYGNADLIIRPD